MTSFLTVLLASLVLLLCTPSAGARQIHSDDADQGGLTASNGQPFPWDSMRLPDHVLPLHYDLLIHPNLTSLDFTGEATIKMAVQKDTSVIVLHSKELKISHAALLKSDGSVDRPLEVLEYPAYQQIALMSSGLMFRAGEVYSARLKFAAKLSESFHGFYKSSYRTNEGEVR